MQPSCNLVDKPPHYAQKKWLFRHRCNDLQILHGLFIYTPPQNIILATQKRVINIKIIRIKKLAFRANFIKIINDIKSKKAHKI